MKDNRTRNAKEITSKTENMSHEEEISNAYLLIVFSPFGQYKRGDLIVDDREVIRVLSCHEQYMVNKIKKTEKE